MDADAAVSQQVQEQHLFCFFLFSTQVEQKHAIQTTCVDPTISTPNFSKSKMTVAEGSIKGHLH